MRRQLRSSRSYLRASAPHDRSLTSRSRTISLSRSRFFEVVRPFGLPGFFPAPFHDVRGGEGLPPVLDNYAGLRRHLSRSVGTFKPREASRLTPRAVRPTSGLQIGHLVVREPGPPQVSAAVAYVRNLAVEACPGMYDTANATRSVPLGPATSARTSLDSILFA